MTGKEAIQTRVEDVGCERQAQRPCTCGTYATQGQPTYGVFVPDVDADAHLIARATRQRARPRWPRSPRAGAGSKGSSEITA
jgi:hypothetical protein